MLDTFDSARVGAYADKKCVKELNACLLAVSFLSY